MRIGWGPRVVVGCGSVVFGTVHYACSDDYYAVIRCAIGRCIERYWNALWNLSGLEGRKARSDYRVEQELTRCALEAEIPGCK